MLPYSIITHAIETGDVDVLRPFVNAGPALLEWRGHTRYNSLFAAMCEYAHENEWATVKEIAQSLAEKGFDVHARWDNSLAVTATTQCNAPQAIA